METAVLSFCFFFSFNLFVLVAPSVCTQGLSTILRPHYYIVFALARQLQWKNKEPVPFMWVISAASLQRSPSRHFHFHY